MNDVQVAAPDEPESESPNHDTGIFTAFGTMPSSTVLSEDGLATIMGKNCRESIKRAVERGELPQPTKLMGKNCWTAGKIVAHIEASLDAEARRVHKARPRA